MNDPEHFLSRWSRKKREENGQDRRIAKRDDRQDAATPPVDPSPATALGEMPRKPPAAAQSTASAPAFDRASLPSIESIGAETDISAFLKPGVPSELRHAALRRAWSVDPTIRDFKGLQENDWNFNDPNGIPGFGSLSPDIDVKKMAAMLFGGSPKSEPADEAGRAGRQAPATKDNSVRGSERAAIASAREPLGNSPAGESFLEQNKLVRREENIAPQKERQESESSPAKSRRSRGGALPQS